MTNIPEELQDVKQWVIFVQKPDPNREGKLTKIPWNVSMKYKASSTNHLTWATFDQVMEKCESMESEYGHGAGFVFKHPYFGIDIDNCVKDGVISDFALEIINKFKSYTEFSPSGKGIHIIAKLEEEVKFGRKKDELGLECYTHSRFFTMTGKTIDGVGSPWVESRQDEFNSFTKKFWTDKPKSELNLPNHNSLTVEDVISRTTDDEKFFELFVEGDISQYDNDRSRADGALCMKLAFYTERNPRLMDELFRRSALMRPKWDEQRGEVSYAEYQINNAISIQAETYDADKFKKEDEPPATQEEEPNTKIHPDIRYASKFLKNNTIVYCPERRLIYQYENGYYSPICDEQVEMKMIMDPLGKSFGNSKRNNILKNIKVMSHKQLKEFNSKGYLTFNNVLFHTDSLSFMDHTPEVINTISIGYDYVPSAQCPNWEKFLNSSLENDREKIDIIQEFFGYCLQRSCKHEKALFLVGEGQNGKGTLIFVLERLLGSENCSHASLKQLAVPEGRGVIVDKMVNIDSEMDPKASEYEDSFKKITSGEYVDINEKYVPQYSYQPFCKMIFCANDLPYIKDMSYGFYRRFVPISFDRVFTEKERDIDLKERLLSELPGVFNWAVKGLQRLEKNRRFTVSKAVTEYARSIEVENKPILQFIEDCVEWDEQSYIEKSTLYDTYVKWAGHSGHRGVFSKIKFGRYFYKAMGQKVGKNMTAGHNKIGVWGCVKLAGAFFPNIPANQQSEGWSD